MNTYESNRKSKRDQIINDLKEKYKNNKGIAICVGSRCKNRVQPITEFTIKSNGTYSTCASCRKVSIKQNKNISKEVKQRADRNYYQSDNGNKKISEKNKKYRENNKAKAQQVSNNYYQKNKDKINEKKRLKNKVINELTQIINEDSD